jgi:hypothetical protein
MINFAMKLFVTDSLSEYRARRRDIQQFSDRFEIEIEITVEAIAKALESWKFQFLTRKEKDRMQC